MELIIKFSAATPVVGCRTESSSSSFQRTEIEYIQQFLGLSSSKWYNVLDNNQHSSAVISTSNYYIPGVDDIGFYLKVDCFAKCSQQNDLLAKIGTKITEPVIDCPPLFLRKIVPTRLIEESNEHKFESISVLSYNVLADDLTRANTNLYNCPEFALQWDYRPLNILNELSSYKADFLCLQEVRSHHLTKFFKPRLSQLGYNVLYKRRCGKEVYTSDGYVTHGCAICYRKDRLRLVKK